MGPCFLMNLTLKKQKGFARVCQSTVFINKAEGDKAIHNNSSQTTCISVLNSSEMATRTCPNARPQGTQLQRL